MGTQQWSLHRADFACAPPLASSTTTSEKPDKAEIRKLNRSKLNKTETQEKNPSPSQETMEQEKQTGES
ncbi:thymosin beta-4-like [Tamandua tetradactyla]|uniref:thymosin beta-4-like n=1 Tax=Tamandua tetradactyla TaxID=48850 RepID=UPI004053D165